MQQEGQANAPFPYQSSRRIAMTTMTRFIPIRSNFNEIAELQNRLNAIFQEFARPESGAEPAAPVASSGAASCPWSERDGGARKRSCAVA